MVTGADEQLRGMIKGGADQLSGSKNMWRCVRCNFQIAHTLEYAQSGKIETT